MIPSEYKSLVKVQQEDSSLLKVYVDLNQFHHTFYTIASHLYIKDIEIVKKDIEIYQLSSSVLVCFV